MSKKVLQSIALLFAGWIILASCGGAESGGTVAPAGPEAAVPAAARPQLIEFYANW